MEAVRNLLGDGTRRIISLDEMRRGFESFGVAKYQALSFYRRRVDAIVDVLVEKQVVTRADYAARAAEIRGRWVDLEEVAYAHHDHDHEHGALVVEDEAGNVEAQVLIDALQALLAERGLLSPAEFSREIEKSEASSVHLGARIVFSKVKPGLVRLSVVRGRGRAMAMRSATRVGRRVSMSTSSASWIASSRSWLTRMVVICRRCTIACSCWHISGVSS